MKSDEEAHVLIIKYLCLTIILLALFCFIIIWLWTAIYWSVDEKALVLMIDKILVQTKIPKEVWGITWLGVIVIVLKILISKPLKQ